MTAEEVKLFLGDSATSISRMRYSLEACFFGASVCLTAFGIWPSEWNNAVVSLFFVTHVLSIFEESVTLDVGRSFEHTKLTLSRQQARRQNVCALFTLLSDLLVTALQIRDLNVNENSHWVDGTRMAFVSILLMCSFVKVVLFNSLENK